MLSFLCGVVRPYCFGRVAKLESCSQNNGTTQTFNKWPNPKGLHVKQARHNAHTTLKFLFLFHKSLNYPCGKVTMQCLLSFHLWNHLDRTSGNKKSQSFWEWGWKKTGNRVIKSIIPSSTKFSEMFFFTALTLDSNWRGDGKRKTPNYPHNECKHSSETLHMFCKAFKEIDR